MSTAMCRQGRSLVSHIKRGEEEEATNLLLTESPTLEDIHRQDDKDGDALFWASCRGYSLLVELLLTLGAKVTAVSLASGGTPLHAAADNGRISIIRLLLKWGADKHARNHFRDTPCHLAAFRGHSKGVQLFLKASCDIQLRNSRNNTVLDEAKCGQLIHRDGQHTLVQHLLYGYEPRYEHSEPRDALSTDTHRSESQGQSVTYNMSGPHNPHGWEETEQLSYLGSYLSNQGNRRHGQRPGTTQNPFTKR